MDEPNNKGHSTHKQIYSLLLSAWLVIAGFVIYLAYQEQLSQTQGGFVQESSRLKEFLDARLLSNEAVIAGFAAYLEISQDSDQQRASAYVKHILGHYPHIHAIGYLDIVDQPPIPVVSEPSAHRAFEPVSPEVAGEPAVAGLNDAAAYRVHLMGAESTKLGQGLDMRAIPSLEETLTVAAKINDAVATRPFQRRDGGMAYALMQPVTVTEPGPSPRAQRYAMLLISVEYLLPSAPIHLHQGLRVSMHFGDQRILVNETSLFSLNGPASSPLASLLLPAQTYQAKVGGPRQNFFVHIRRQLNWNELRLELLLGIGLIVLLSFTLLAIYTRALYRSEKERLAIARHYKHQALHDPLTDLPNRVLIADRLSHAIENARRWGSQVAILFLDLDNFKAVNDQYGHQVGDELLKAFAERLKAKVRRNDTVGRISGDEFIVIFEHSHTPAEVESMAAALKSELCGAYLLCNHVISIAYSMGLSYFPGDGQSCTELLKSADQRMYKNKVRHKPSDRRPDPLACSIE